MSELLNIISLTKVFGKKTVLDDFSLSVLKGEFIAILGPSGCGKSTLLRLICGLEKPERGKIIVENNNIAHLDPKDRNIAMVFQNYALYPHKTVYQNLSLGLQIQNQKKKLLN
ncbi:MAG: hypothetical protein CMF96_02385 [Candidatus Marinimicrobia bacterium]|nr:hypothetical protein [Candidatus Neomarinimicrobiota bacterium]|tara:strand:- start:94 stop:432 length:339 start_codon:yes stop_codon:yes gene_type:complete